MSYGRSYSGDEDNPPFLYFKIFIGNSGLHESQVVASAPLSNRFNLAQQPGQAPLSNR